MGAQNAGESGCVARRGATWTNCCTIRKSTPNNSILLTAAGVSNTQWWDLSANGTQQAQNHVANHVFGEKRRNPRMSR